MNVLVTGATGMLGTDVVACAPSIVTVHAAGRADLDLRHGERIASVLDAVGPEWVINCAAFTAVDRAESEPAEALAVNATAVGSLGRACAERGIRVVHVGSDYVFPGDATQPYAEDDPVAPLNSYGASKLAGERALLGSGARALIVRTQWLFGANGRSFPRTMWARATSGLATRVVDDQVGRPTYTVDLARAIWELVQRDTEGVVHVANVGTATWFSIAERVFEAAGTRHLLSPCRTAEYPAPARRPAFSVLDTTKAEALLGRALPPWQEALDRFLARLRSEAPLGAT